MLVVREADAAAVVVDVMMVLGARGHDIAITPDSGPRLIRLGALMLAEFGITDRERVGDERAAAVDRHDQAAVPELSDCAAHRAAAAAVLLL